MQLAAVAEHHALVSQQNSEHQRGTHLLSATASRSILPPSTPSSLLDTSTSLRAELPRSTWLSASAAFTESRALALLDHTSHVGGFQQQPDKQRKLTSSARPDADKHSWVNQQLRAQTVTLSANGNNMQRCNLLSLAMCTWHKQVHGIMRAVTSSILV